MLKRLKLSSAVNISVIALLLHSQMAGAEEFCKGLQLVVTTADEAKRITKQQFDELEHERAKNHCILFGFQDVATYNTVTLTDGKSIIASCECVGDRLNSEPPEATACSRVTKRCSVCALVSQTASWLSHHLIHHTENWTDLFDSRQTLLNQIRERAEYINIESNTISEEIQTHARQWMELTVKGASERDPVEWETNNAQITSINEATTLLEDKLARARKHAHTLLDNEILTTQRALDQSKADLSLAKSDWNPHLDFELLEAKVASQSSHLENLEMIRDAKWNMERYQDRMAKVIDWEIQRMSSKRMSQGVGGTRPSPDSAPPLPGRPISRVGLPNLGNTCFANSVFQMMLAYPDLLGCLSQELDLDPSRGEQDLARRQDLQRSMRDLFTMIINNPVNSQRDQATLRNHLFAVFEQTRVNGFFPRLGNDGPRTHAVPGTQQDAQEFQIGLFEKLQFSKCYGNFQVSKFRTFHQTDNHRVAKKLEIPKPTESLILETNRDTTLNSMIRDHLSTEQMVDRANYAEFAPGDQRPSEYKTLLLKGLEEHIPQIPIQLRRYGDERHEVTILDAQGHGEIILPFYPSETTLDTVERTQPERVMMQPTSIIVHIGKDGAGHYLTYTRHPDGWYEFDDSTVSKLEGARLSKAIQLINNHAYLVLFSRVP